MKLGHELLPDATPTYHLRTFNEEWGGRTTRDMIVKLLYLGMPILLGVGMAITTYKILGSSPRKLGRKFAIIVFLTILSLGFFWLPKWHRITETVYPNGFRSVNEVNLEPRFFQKTAPLIGIIIGVALVQFKKT